MHIFQEPLSLHELDPSIPIALSDMVSKLMEKDVDLRYQSAKGIMCDIHLIMSECTSLETALPLAQHDLSDTLLLPQKLYGFSNEHRKLTSVHNRITSSSSFELVFIIGRSGMGKTALALELKKPAVQKGMFIIGKHDYSKSEPYSALIDENVL